MSKILINFQWDHCQWGLQIYVWYKSMMSDKSPTIFKTGTRYNVPVNRWISIQSGKSVISGNATSKSRFAWGHFYCPYRDRKLCTSCRQWRGVLPSMCQFWKHVAAVKVRLCPSIVCVFVLWAGPSEWLRAAGGAATTSTKTNDCWTFWTFFM